MSAENEAVVRRFYEELCNQRRPEVADEIITDDHVYHDPQVPAGLGPEGAKELVRPYQEAIDGHWGVEDVFSSGDMVCVRWIGTGTHRNELMGLAPTGKPIRVDALSVHRISGGKIAETWTVWDTLGMLQQVGAVPAPAGAAA
jgi:steroid delta-isomerase-like uncharacterized protein